MKWWAEERRGGQERDELHEKVFINQKGGYLTVEMKPEER